jgi:hypothetical protein
LTPNIEQIVSKGKVERKKPLKNGNFLALAT